MEQRRKQYASYSPVFWHPAEDVVDLHAQFLRGLIGSQATIALRTDYGFIICQSRENEGFVDDFAVQEPGTWDSDGAALLLAVAEQPRASGNPDLLRVVTAHADKPKVRMLETLSMRLAEQWWVKELCDAAPEPARAGRITGPGFSGQLGPAPPVYDPGGLVFQAEGVDEAVDLDVVEHRVAELGAVLAIIPAAPGSILASELEHRGWTVAPDWYVGSPFQR
jgi:hypothetical protein